MSRHRQLQRLRTCVAEADAALRDLKQLRRGLSAVWSPSERRAWRGKVKHHGSK